MTLRPETIQKFRSVPQFDDFIVALYDWIEGESFDYENVFTTTDGLCVNYLKFCRHCKLDMGIQLSPVFRRVYGSIFPFNTNMNEYEEECEYRFGIFGNKERKTFIKEMYNAIMADRKIPQSCDQF